MPLGARTGDGGTVIATELSDEEWASLGRDVKAGMCAVYTTCCGRRAYLRVRQTTRHFVHHRRDGCTWPPESPAHLRAKVIIVRACRLAGYEVQTEVTGPDDRWRADVLASKGEAHIAFEVQVSDQ